MDTFHPVDYYKSIEKQKLVYESSSDLTFDYVLFFLVIFIFVGASLYLVIMMTLFESVFPLYYAVAILLVDAWLIANAVLLNSFIIINGKGANENRVDVIKALGQSLTLENLDQSENNLIRDVRLSAPFQDGRVVTCLIDNETIYLNITSLMRGNAFSIFGGLYNYFRCKSIAEDFGKLQASPLVKN